MSASGVVGRQRKPLLLLSLFSLLVALYGVVVLGWSIGGLIALYYYEMVLIAGFVLARVFLALNGRSIFKDLLLRVVLVVIAVLSMGLVLFFIVAFTAGSIAGNLQGFSLADPAYQMQETILLLGYCSAFIGGYLLNGEFLRAEPIAEFLAGITKTGIVLVLILLSTGSLGNYFEQTTPMAVVIAILVAKFLGEYAASNIHSIEVVDKDSPT